MASQTQTLSSGHTIPTLGFGTYLVGPDSAAEVVYQALRSGYRHIDSAAYYRNERGCGEAIKRFIAETGTSRSEIFYTTKLRSEDLGYELTKIAIDKSLREVGLDYIDLYLIHTPFPGTCAGRLGSWRAMEEAVEEGKLRSLGISNFGVHHLQALLDSGLKIKPAVGQYELHPWNLRKELVELHKKHNITLEAFSPITQGVRFQEPSLQALAAKYQKSPAQILLRWSVQKGYVPLVKSSKPERMQQNQDLFSFELTEEDNKSLENDEYFLTTPGYDPSLKPLDGEGKGFSYD